MATQVKTPQIASGITLTSPTINTPTFSAGAVGNTALSTSAILLGIATSTTGFTTSSASSVQVTGLTLTVTMPAGGRMLKLSANTGQRVTATTGGGCFMNLWEGTVGSGTQLCEVGDDLANAGSISLLTVVYLTPSAGSHTYNVGFRAASATSTTVAYAVGSPGFFIAEIV